MQSKYCLPIIKPSKAEVLSIIEQSKSSYGYFEVWVDYIEAFETSFAPELVYKFPGRVVLVFRRQNLEPIKMPTEQRFKVLDAVSGKDCLVDLDITCQTEDLAYIKGKDIKKIGSYHNYENTPPDAKLQEIVSEIKSYSPYISKLSTYCEQASDALRLINIKKDFLETGQKHIVLGMGKEGEITRVFGALWGNELIFIPESSEEASAPGQITRTEFEKIMERAGK